MKGLWGARVPWRGECGCVPGKTGLLVPPVPRGTCSPFFGMLESCDIVGSSCSVCPVLVIEKVLESLWGRGQRVWSGRGWSWDG